MNRKYFYYVGIITESSDLRFITSVDNASNALGYNEPMPPLVMKKSVAESLADRLLMNCVAAVVVKSAFEITGHPGVKSGVNAEKGGDS